MAYADIVKVTILDAAFSERDKQVILGVIEEAYEKSAIAREMFDSWVAAGRTIRFDYGDGRFDAWNGVVTLDLRELDKASYVDFNGKAIQDYPFTAIIHELGHALKLLPDNWSPLNPAGDNQNYVNAIYEQAGYQKQLAYMAYDASGRVLVRDREYTDGLAIDNAWVKKWTWLPNDFDVEEGGRYTDPRRDLIIGSADDNVLKSGGGDDFVYGLAGNDTLHGGTGDDRLNGGEGADVLYGGEGSDFASYAYAGTGVIASLANAAINTGDAKGDTFVSIENLIGSGFDDKLFGDAAANRIEGRDGNDVLDGAAGADTLVGGNGNDSYLVDNVNDKVVELAGQGTDRVISTIDWTLGDNVENLQLVFNGNTSGTGNALANYIGGNSGNNVLDGGAGADTLVGGGGNDSYIVDNANDKVVELAGQGTDRVISTIDWTLGDNVENLQLVFNGDTFGVGNELANYIGGNSGNNVLYGRGGNDTLVGGGGDDILIGGEGNDVLVGGSGTDTACYLSAFANYSVAATGGKLKVSGVEGTDSLESVELLLFLDGTYDVASSQFTALAGREADLLVA